MRKIFLTAICLGIVASLQLTASSQSRFKVLATNKTSTMEKELNQAADLGYRLEGFNGGETAFGGKETVAIVSLGPDAKARYKYKLLATSKTSTMQKELQQYGNDGFEYKGQTVFETTFGGKEVVTILEKDTTVTEQMRYEYKLFATSKTSTMEKELNTQTDATYKFVGITVAETTFGGKEVVVITRRRQM